jgi:outer membrane protein
MVMLCLPLMLRALSTRPGRAHLWCAGLCLAGAAQAESLTLTLSNRLSAASVQATLQAGEPAGSPLGPDRPARCDGMAPSRLSALTMIDALDLVICRNPQLGQALLLVDERQAAVSEADSAFWPRFSASAEYAANRIPSGNSDVGSLGSSLTGAIGLSWTLFDFGARSAAARQSRFSLDAARAAQQTAGLNAVNEGMRLYVDAAAAQTRLEAARETESIAARSLEVVQGKYQAQVAGLTEKLQTETVLAQARLERVRAEGAWDTARGLLAVAMGLSAEERLGLAAPQQAFPRVEPPVVTGDWVATTAAQHPRVRGAAAEVQALQARLEALQADGKGNVGVSLGVATTRDLAERGGRFEQNLTGSVVATVPLFNGREQRAREAQAVAQIGARDLLQTQARREVESDLWRNLEQLQAEQAAMQATSDLLVAAAKSYEISFGRYRSGVGSIQELLATQGALANAQTQMTQARLARAYASLRLSVASGRLMISR